MNNNVLFDYYRNSDSLFIEEENYNHNKEDTPEYLPPSSDEEDDFPFLEKGRLRGGLFAFNGR